MNPYTIEWFELKKTRTNKTFAKASLKALDGSITDEVSIWDDFPDFATLKAGSTVFGTIKTNDKGYKNLYGSKFPSKPIGRANTAVITAAKITQESVREAQQNKNASIAYFNATNSALTILKILGKSGLFDDMVQGRTQEAQKIITDWREWFLSEFRKYEAGDQTDKTRPF